MNRAIKADIGTTRVEKLDVSVPALSMTDAHRPGFDRLRAEAPADYRKDSVFGSYRLLSSVA